MASLLNMPDIVMTLILEKSDFNSIQCLRKSCRDLRNFIDSVKPESKIFNLHARLRQNSIILGVTIDGLYSTVTYESHESGCKVKTANTTRLLENSSFLEVACQDMQYILDWKNSSKILEEFCVHVESDFELVLKPNIRSKHCSITFTLPTQIPKYLALVDSAILEKITLTFLGIESFLLNLYEVYILDQWKQAKLLNMINFRSDTPSENFGHFKKIYIKTRVITSGDVLRWKSIFLKGAPNGMAYVNYRYDNLIDEQELTRKFGHPIHIALPNLPPKRHWFFAIPGNSEIVHSIGFDSTSFVFFLLHKEGLPVGAHIN